MALKVKAKEQLIKVGKYADTYRFVLSPELYIPLAQNKVISEAALRSGISKGVMQACWDAAGEVKVTQWHCQDSEQCVSDCVQSQWQPLTR